MPRDQFVGKPNFTIDAYDLYKVQSKYVLAQN